MGQQTTYELSTQAGLQGWQHEAYGMVCAGQFGTFLHYVPLVRRCGNVVMHAVTHVMTRLKRLHDLPVCTIIHTYAWQCRDPVLAPCIDQHFMLTSPILA